MTSFPPNRMTLSYPVCVGVYMYLLSELFMLQDHYDVTYGVKWRHFLDDVIISCLCGGIYLQYYQQDYLYKLFVFRHLSLSL